VASALPVLVALLVGAIAAGGVSLGMGDSPRQLGPDPQRPPLAAVEHGSVLGNGPLLADQQPPPPAPPPPAPPSTTTEPPATTEPPPPPPPPTTTEPPTVPVPDPASVQEARVVELVNAERAERGCAALTVDARLANAAQAHSTDMATRRYFSHESPEGETFVDRAHAAGYPSPAAENIARGQRSADQVMDDWMDSSGHRRNILNCELRTIGVGLDTRGWYWTQVFGR
jgi:uncharacterized protein YkwD